VIRHPVSLLPLNVRLFTGQRKKAMAAAETIAGYEHPVTVRR
jgi:hypothetical protein